MKEVNVQKMRIGKNRLTTYALGLVQDKVYRMLKHQTRVALSKHAISTTEWVFLGLLYDHGGRGSRLSELGKQLGVTAPFVTALVDRLITKGYVTRDADPADHRAKIVMLSNVGKTFVPTIEKELRRNLQGIIKGVSLSRFETYVQVLQDIAENGEVSVDADLDDSASLV